MTNQQPDFNKFIAGRDGGDLDDDDDESPLEEEDNKHIYHDNVGDNMVQNSKMGWFKSIFSNSGSGTSNASNSKLLGVLLVAVSQVPVAVPVLVVFSED